MNRFAAPLPLLMATATAALCAGAISYGAPSACAQAATAPAKTLLEMGPGAVKRLTPSSAQVTVTRSADTTAPGTIVAIAPGTESYPGVALKPEGGAPWDLSAYGHVAARVTNLGAKPLTLALRVDNAGDWRDNPWNTESITLAPGASGVVTVIFGRSYGHKPGYALKPAAVVGLLLFAGKSDAPQSFRIESLTAGGPAGEMPPVAPEDIRVKPKDGRLLTETTQLSTHSAQATRFTESGPSPELHLAFLAGDGEQSVSLKPAQGRWDLRDCLEVRVRLRNDGKVPVSPRVWLESNGGPSDTVTTTLAPGAEREVVIPFAGASVADPGQKGSGSRLTSDAVSAVTLATDGAGGARVLRVEEVRADVPPAPALPAWLGKRPPVEGDWVRTLDDEFRGPTLDPARWSIYGANYWDKQSHWSKENVLLGGGVVRLRYTKKTGFSNDDPSQKQTAYASGYLHTYDKWAQRYGYFEARMKLPTAPGLWPAFWMMPDRGAAAGPQGQRQDTGNGGMEFDIMEYLTRWGPYRYNIAMHYDGYGKDHKSVGTDKIYVQPDKEGYLTCGLLWLPGAVTYYCNGRPVLHWEDPRISRVPEILMFTLPQGGWDNSPLVDDRLPDDFVIDYVRVWQRKDLATGGAAVAKTANATH